MCNDMDGLRGELCCLKYTRQRETATGMISFMWNLNKSEP